MRDLVFVHGRSQQNKDAVALKREWLDAFSEGLKASGLQLPLSDAAVHFPYYGDTLMALVNDVPPEEVPDIVVKGTNAGVDELRFAGAILDEIRNQVGLTDQDVLDQADQQIVQKGPLNWAWVQAILRTIDRRVPHGSGASIALFTKDVYQYLRNQGVRDAIDDGVRKAIPFKPTVVVAHSLGSVVAYSLLRRDGELKGWDIPVLVTVGCPLAVTMIKDSLAPRQHPKCVGDWFNARDDRDVVALYPLDQPHGWGVIPTIANKNDVKNPTDNRHGIAGYLSDPVVARKIYDAILK